MAHSSNCCSLTPVCAARVLRPLTLRAASSSPSVVRMPNDFSFDAAKGGRPSILEIGYVMALNNQKCTSSKMTETRCCGNDLGHLVRAALVASKIENVFRQSLYLAHRQAKLKKPGSERHRTAAHQVCETAVVA